VDGLELSQRVVGTVYATGHGGHVEGDVRDSGAWSQTRRSGYACAQWEARGLQRGDAPASPDCPRFEQRTAPLDGRDSVCGAQRRRTSAGGAVIARQRQRRCGRSVCSVRQCLQGHVRPFAAHHLAFQLLCYIFMDTHMSPGVYED
jgi:hypothetical protein